MENYFYENKGNGTFTDEALVLGLALGQNGQGVSSMGPAVADLDADGSLDIMIPDMDYGSLLSKKGGFYQDLVGRSGLAVILRPVHRAGAPCSSTTTTTRHPDLFIANGNAHHEYSEDPVLARNDGKGVFVDVARGAGRVLPEEVGEPRRDLGRLRRRRQRGPRGGRHLRGRRTSSATKGGTGNDWLKVDARVKGGHRTAIGARVTVGDGGAAPGPGRDRGERLPLPGRPPRRTSASGRRRRPTSCGCAGRTARSTSGRT